MSGSFRVFINALIKIVTYFAGGTFFNLTIMCTRPNHSTVITQSKRRILISGSSFGLIFMVVRINLMHKFSFPNASISNFEKLIEQKSLFQFTNDCYATSPTTRRLHPYVYLKRQTCKLTGFDRVEFCVVSDSFARPINGVHGSFYIHLVSFRPYQTLIVTGKNY
jgi:hypothetical protein